MEWVKVVPSSMLNQNYFTFVQSKNNMKSDFKEHCPGFLTFKFEKIFLFILHVLFVCMYTVHNKYEVSLSVQI